MTQNEFLQDTSSLFREIELKEMHAPANDFNRWVHFSGSLKRAYEPVFFEEVNIEFFLRHIDP